MSIFSSLSHPSYLTFYSSLSSSTAMANTIASSFSEKEIDQLMADFMKADTNHNGTLDYSEFTKLFAHLPVCFPSPPLSSPLLSSSPYQSLLIFSHYFNLITISSSTARLFVDVLSSHNFLFISHVTLFIA